ncbi:hypothetical protein RJT34_12523 [Clitoria ternatea]|uniref:Uncharacterized protein n=1 Tax=Clitoria ternatea TaxID=43366 RepID=A0AAN9PKT8_CLITE
MRERDVGDGGRQRDGDGGDGRSSVEVDDGEGEGDEEGGDDVDGVTISTKKMTEAVAPSSSFSFVSLADWSLLILGFLIFQVVEGEMKKSLMMKMG